MCGVIFGNWSGAIFGKHGGGRAVGGKWQNGLKCTTYTLGEWLGRKEAGKGGREASPRRTGEAWKPFCEDCRVEIRSEVGSGTEDVLMRH
jgi:hypothetical protein